MKSFIFSAEIEAVSGLRYRTLFVRQPVENIHNIEYVFSDDGGASWSTPRYVASCEPSSPISFFSNGRSRIDLFFRSRSASTREFCVFHCYIGSSTLPGNVGFTAGDMDIHLTELPSTNTKLASPPDDFRIYDLVVGSQRYPAVVLYALSSLRSGRASFYQARWSGTEWKTSELFSIDDDLSSKLRMFEYQMSTDRDDVDIVYVRRHGHNLVKNTTYRSQDNGATWCAVFSIY